MSDKVLNIEISGTNFKLTDQEQSYVEKRCERKLQDQIRRYKTERRNDGVNRGGFVAKIKRSLRRQ